jgi:PAS domain S-box-containing protein
MIVGKLLDDLNVDVTPLLGTSVFDDPASRPEVIEAIRRTLDEGVATSFPAEGQGRRFHVFVSPHLDANGKPIGAVTAALDVTDTAEKQRALTEANAELAEWQLMVNTLLGTAPLGVALVDGDARYMYINDYLAQLNGRPASEHVGKPLREVIPPEVAEYMEGLINTVYESGKPLLGIPGEAESPMYPGEVRRFEAGLYPLNGADGRKIGVGVILSDVTDHRRGERREQDAQPAAV